MPKPGIATVKVSFCRPTVLAVKISLVAVPVLLLPISSLALASHCSYSPSGWPNCLEEVDINDPLGTRTPLILIHGWNPESIPASPQTEVWANFVYYLYSNPSLKNKFKPYYFSYFSNDISVFDLGGKLRDVLDSKNGLDPANFGAKPIVILAHSIGGLVARSFMQQHWQLQGAFAGQPGGERVLKLITLGTPHYGSPLANDQALRWRLPLWGFLINAYAEWFLKVDYDELNRANLRWDNHFVAHAVVDGETFWSPVLTVTVQPALSPAISVTPSSVDFGGVNVGTTKDLSFTVANVGGGTLLGNATATAPFPFREVKAKASAFDLVLRL